MLLMRKKSIRGRIFHTIHQYVKANHKYIKEKYMIKIKNHRILNAGM